MVLNICWCLDTILFPYVSLKVSCCCHGHNLSCSDMLEKVNNHHLDISKKLCIYKQDRYS